MYNKPVNLWLISLFVVFNSSGSSAPSTTTTSADCLWPVSTICRSYGPCKWHCSVFATHRCAEGKGSSHPCLFVQLIDRSVLTPSPPPPTLLLLPHLLPPPQPIPSYLPFLSSSTPRHLLSPSVDCTPTTCSVTATLPGCQSGYDSAPVWVSTHNAWPRHIWGGTTWLRCRRRSLSAQVGPEEKGWDMWCVNTGLLELFSVFWHISACCLMVPNPVSVLSCLLFLTIFCSCLSRRGWRRVFTFHCLALTCAAFSGICSD